MDGWMDGWMNEWTSNHTHTSSQDRLITQVLSHIGLMQNANALFLTPTTNTHCSIQITNHVGRLRGDSEAERHVVHVENHNAGVLGTSLRNTRQTYTDQTRSTVETSFGNMIAVQERHLRTWLHPHFVLGGTGFAISIPGHTAPESRERWYEGGTCDSYWTGQTSFRCSSSYLATHLQPLGVISHYKSHEKGKREPDIVNTVFMETKAMRIILLVHQLLHIRSDTTGQKVHKEAYYFVNFAYKTLVSSWVRGRMIPKFRNGKEWKLFATSYPTNSQEKAIN